MLKIIGTEQADGKPFKWQNICQGNSTIGVCKYVSLEEKQGMDWDPELLWEGFKSW